MSGTQFDNKNLLNGMYLTMIVLTACLVLILIMYWRQMKKLPGKMDTFLSFIKMSKKRQQMQSAKNGAAEGYNEMALHQQLDSMWWQNKQKNAIMSGRTRQEIYGDDMQKQQQQVQKYQNYMQGDDVVSQIQKEAGDDELFEESFRQFNKQLQTSIESFNGKGGVTDEKSLQMLQQQVGEVTRETGGTSEHFNSDFGDVDDHVPEQYQEQYPEQYPEHYQPLIGDAVPEPEDLEQISNLRQKVQSIIENQIANPVSGTSSARWQYLRDTGKMQKLEELSYTEQNIFKQFAYTKGKGELTRLCLKDKEGRVSDDVLMYALVHELTHAYDVKYLKGQHDFYFWVLFSKLMMRAVEIGVLSIRIFDKKQHRCGVRVLEPMQLNQVYRYAMQELPARQM